MSHIADIAAAHNARTAEYSIVRLHGPSRQGIEEGPRAAASIISRNASEGIKTVVNVNKPRVGFILSQYRRAIAFFPIPISRLFKMQYQKQCRNCHAIGA